MPREGFRRIVNYHPVWLFIFILALISTSLSVTGKIISPFGLNYGSFDIAIGAVALFFMLFFKIIIATTIFNYSAECVGGRGNCGAALMGFGFSFMPLIFTTPFLIITLIIDQPAKGLLSFLIFLSLGFWVVCLQIAGIKEIYSLTTGRAFIAYIAPILIILFLFGAIFISFIANFITKFAGFFQSLPF
ncbi:YIP1 family protein [bacterium]|nr:YIP1 family protein [bacterium]